jgi:hypothetical protein
MKIYALGIDLGKTLFHLADLDASKALTLRGSKRGSSDGQKPSHRNPTVSLRAALVTNSLRRVNKEH